MCRDVGRTLAVPIVVEILAAMRVKLGFYYFPSEVRGLDFLCRHKSAGY